MQSCVQLLIFDTLIIITRVLSDAITPIDFEYGGPNFMIFDIANHFCEFGGKKVDSK